MRLWIGGIGNLGRENFRWSGGSMSLGESRETLRNEGQDKKLMVGAEESARV